MARLKLNNNYTNKSYPQVNNLLLLKSAANQYVSIPHVAAYDFSNNNSFFFGGVLETFSGEQSAIFYKRNPTLPVENDSGFCFYYTPSSDINPGEGTFKFLIVASGVSYEVSAGLVFNIRQLLHYVCAFEVISSSSFELRLYINGVISNKATFAAVGNFSNSAAIACGRFVGHPPPLPFYGHLGYVFLASGVITDSQVKQLHHKIGVIPESLRASIKGFWPLNQATGKTAPDLVENFNSYKTSPLAANPGALINYTDAETGVPSPATNTAWVNFYFPRNPVANPGPYTGTGATYADSLNRVIYKTWTLETNAIYSDGHKGRYSNQVGAHYEQTGTGTQIEVWSPKGPSYGTFNVLVDGVLIGTYSAVNATLIAAQKITTVTGLTSGAHKIRVVRVSGFLICDKIVFLT